MKGNRFILGVLISINLANYADRYTVTGVLPLLQDKDDSGFPSDVSDTLAGLLQMVFIVSYMIFSPFFGYYGDRSSRVVLITIGLIIWSFATFIGSFSSNYYELLASRALVGVGEASYATLSPTLIADMYPPETRTMYLAYFYTAIPVGSGLGFVIGGEIGNSFGWQWAFRVTPPICIILAIVVYFFVEEPQRGQSDGVDSNSSQSHNQSEGWRGMWEDAKAILEIKSFVWSSLAFTCVCFAAGAIAFWGPDYVVRVTDSDDDSDSSDNTDDDDDDDDNLGKISLIFGAITFVTGLTGTVAGSAASKYYEKDYPASDAWVCAIGLFIAAPATFAALLFFDVISALGWILIAVAEFFLFLNWAPVNAILLSVVPPHRRGTAEAMQIFFSHFFGDAASALIVGGVSDVIQSMSDLSSTSSLRYALMLNIIIIIIGGIWFWVTGRYLENDRKVMKREISEETRELINEADGIEVIPSSVDERLNTDSFPALNDSYE